ncbi:MAG: CPBP family intramembrane glutamic endopeptidase, partial [Actinomycetota bacterium]
LTWALHRKALTPLLRMGRTEILAGLAAGALMTAATYLLFPLCVRMAPGLARATGDLYALFNNGWAPLRLSLLPLVILGEELVWRGLVQTVVERRAGGMAGALMTALLYAAAHLPAATPLLALVALCCGFYWGALRTATGSLAVPLIAHLVWDLCVMVLFPLT